MKKKSFPKSKSAYKSWSITTNVSGDIVVSIVFDSKQVKTNIINNRNTLMKLLSEIK